MGRRSVGGRAWRSKRLLPRRAPRPQRSYVLPVCSYVLPVLVLAPAFKFTGARAKELEAGAGKLSMVELSMVDQGALPYKRLSDARSKLGAHKGCSLPQSREARYLDGV